MSAIATNVRNDRAPEVGGPTAFEEAMKSMTHTAPVMKGMKISRHPMPIVARPIATVAISQAKVTIALTIADTRKKTRMFAISGGGVYEAIEGASGVSEVMNTPPATMTPRSLDCSIRSGLTESIHDERAPASRVVM